MSFSISSTVKKYPKHPYEEIKNQILDRRYDLSLAFVGKTRAATLNQRYRNKTYSPNVLSFPLDAGAGEVIICPQIANKEAANFDLTPRTYVAFLFIHGCLHLKGHDHGATMERLEQSWLKKFGFR